MDYDIADMMRGVAEHASMQAPPALFRPVWHVGHLVYKGGVPDIPRASLTGSGFLPQKAIGGRRAPSWQPYVTPVSSAVGGGAIPSRPNFLQPLSGGTSTAQF